MNCQHKNFRAQVDVHRLTKSDESDEVVGYAADVSITCDECHMPFRFKGLPAGYSEERPMANMEGIEARMPIEPVS